MNGRVSFIGLGVIRSYLVRFFLLSFLLISVYGGCNGGGGISPPPPPTAPPTSTVLSAVLIDMGDEPVSCDDPIWNEAEEISVATSTVVFGNLYGDGQLNMTGTLGATINFNRGNPAELKLTGLYTFGSGQIFIRARWNDVIFNLDRRRALYNGPADLDKADDPAGWTSQLNDDKIGFAFEIEPGTSSLFGTFQEVGCAASCHNVAGEGMDMRPETGKADIWHWKTSRSEPVGHAADQFAEPVDGRRDDAGIGIEVRNRASGSDRGGPQFIWDGTDEAITVGPRAGQVLDPAFTLLDGHLFDVGAEGRDADNGNIIYQTSCAGCHGGDGEGGAGPTLDSIKFGRLSDAELDAIIAVGDHPGAVTYNALGDTDKADLRLRVFGFWGVPGYYLRMPDGSVADVTTASDLDYSEAGINSLTNITDPQAPDFNEILNKHKFQQDGHCVVLIRDLETGHDDDTQFDTSQGYIFGVALMDNDGINHVGNTRLTLEFSVP